MHADALQIFYTDLDGHGEWWEGTIISDKLHSGALPLSLDIHQEEELQKAVWERFKVRWDSAVSIASLMVE